MYWGVIGTKAQRRTNKLLLLKNCFHCRQQFSPRIGLQNVAARPGGECLLGYVRKAVFANEENFRLGSALANSPRGFNAMYCWQPNVQQDKVGLQFLCFLNCFESVGTFTDDLHCGLFLEQRTDKAAPRLVIVH